MSSMSSFILKLSKKQWLNIGLRSGFIKQARRKDSLDRPLGYSEDYILRKKVHKLDDPYFLGGGSFHAPELVFLPKDASIISGGKLQDIAYDWTLDWAAVPTKTPSPSVVFGLPSKKASQIPNTQNTDPNMNNFAVDLGGKTKSIQGVIKSRANKEIHSLGNYFSQIPLDQIFSILLKYNIVVLQEDGTKWSGFVTSQGDCGSEKATQGPMKFELAVKTENGYSMSNNVLLMTVCTMPSNKLEVLAYIS